MKIDIQDKGSIMANSSAQDIGDKNNNGSFCSIKIDQDPNNVSTYEGSHQSLFDLSSSWIGGAQTKASREGFIEPHGFITRVTSRDGVIGDAWAGEVEPSMGSSMDAAQIPPDVRANPPLEKGAVLWSGAEKRMDLLEAQDDRLCSIKQQGREKQKQLLRQLVPFTQQSQEQGCYAYVNIDNSFVTHVPYMRVKGVDILYDVLVGEEDLAWAKRDMAKWYNGSAESYPQTFGRFKALPFRLRVPKKLTNVWSDDFAYQLTDWLSNLSTTTESHNLIHLEAQLIDDSVHVLLLDDYPSCEGVTLGLKSTLAWPVHILGHRILLAGSPCTSNFPISPIPEMAAFQSEVAKYTSTLAQVEQTKTWALWSLERVIQLYSAQRTGNSDDPSLFVVHKVDYSKVFRPTSNEIREDLSKGSGLPLILDNRQYENLCDSLLLKGPSRSPMMVANSLQYNRFVFGKDLGTPLGLLDALFLFDYGGDWTLPSLRSWLAGLGSRIQEVHAIASNPEKSLLECTVLSYELIRAKKRYEDAMRRSGVHLSHICAWKDLRQLLHYRIIDAAFVKSSVTSSLDDEAYIGIGFACVAHDIVYYGYDLSVAECSSILYTLGAIEGSYETLELSYAVILSGIKYMARVHRYNASGLTLLSTHFWQLCNGRHRFLNCAMSVAEHAHPRVLGEKSTLLDTIWPRTVDEYLDVNAPKHNHALCQSIYDSLMTRCLKLGSAYPTLLKVLVARPYQRIYGKPLDDEIQNLVEVDSIISILDCVCVDSSNEGVELLWDVALFMWDQTGLMWHALLGSLLVVSDRLVGDDTAGYGYENRTWV